jgi:hypothetical protein
MSECCVRLSGAIFEVDAMCADGSRSICATSAMIETALSETECMMRTYVASIGEKAVMAFRAEDDDQARDIIDDQGGSMRSDLKVLDSTDEKPLWDGKSAIETREATPAQHAEWERSRDQAISNGEIDLDAGNDPDEWNVYLMSISKAKKGST